MELTELRIFRAVVEQGGINKAAHALHRVPSNVTTRIKQLEETLGVKLFVRAKKRLELSAEGRLLMNYAEQLLRISAEAQAAMRNGKPRGRLRIGALESTAAARLPPVLSRYHLLYPEVQLDLVTGTSGALVARVNRHDIEAALVAEPFNTAGLEMLTAFVEELALITPKSADPVRTPADIGNRTVIAFAAGCSYRRRLEDWLGGAKVAPDRVMEFQSYHAIVACVAAGAGIAIVPRSVLQGTLGGREVNVTALPARIAKAKTRLVWRAGHHSVALEAMKKLLVRPATPSTSAKR
jgi:DNA-binding transcriptional LysR family regulator